MHTTIRRYRVKLNEADKAIRLTEQELVPIISRVHGFVSYQAVEMGTQAIVAIGVYRDRKAAEEADAATEHWSASRLASLLEGPPKVTLGEVRISLAAADPDECVSAQPQP